MYFMYIDIHEYVMKHFHKTQSLYKLFEKKIQMHHIQLKIEIQFETFQQNSA